MSASDPDSTNSRGVTKARSAAVVQAAYALIVERGFEGLRTRDVAERVRMNSATLHYYFPTKEALIQGVVHYLMQELQTSRTTAEESAGALERLRAEFADIRTRLKEAPDQLVVLTELAVRAWRDPAIAEILSYLDQGWHDHLVSILQAGIAEKTFRSDLDLEATANSMMSQLRGIGYQSKLHHAKLDTLVNQIGLQIERWVLAPIAAKPRQLRMPKTGSDHARRDQ